MPVDESIFQRRARWARLVFRDSSLARKLKSNVIFPSVFVQIFAPPRRCIMVGHVDKPSTATGTVPRAYHL
jgi:hypothetical protein